MKFVYLFGGGKTEGRAEMKELLGGKGAGLAAMSNLDIPVPPGFTITTEVCTHFYKNNGIYPEGLREEVAEGLKHIEEVMGRRFGDPERPLLLSVRSGARASMPGMMDTVLNLGMNERVARGLARLSGDERFAYDSFRRFVSMYGDVVLGLKPETKKEKDPFEVILEKLKRRQKIEKDIELTAAHMKRLILLYRRAIRKRLSMDLPEDPIEQLWGAIAAVFRSWMNPRAVAYRRIYHIPEEWGTAVTVQAMVFGNLSDRSATGVAFTRSPVTGENRLFGEYLTRAQGEEVVAGIRTPKPISRLEEEMPEAFAGLMGIRERLEGFYRDMQDIEFTIEDGRLYILQTRSGKRTGFAAVRIAVEMSEAGMLSKEEALMRVEPEQLNQLLQPVFDYEEVEKAKKAGRVIAKGLPAGPGAASGRIVLFADEAEEMAARGERVILVRHETSPEDIRGMKAAQGILTARGGMTSHAALVARQMGKVCIVGCESLTLDYRKGIVMAGGKTFEQGDHISIDGTLGEVFEGEMETKPSEVVEVLVKKTRRLEDSSICRNFLTLLSWADSTRRLRVRANADKPDQAATAVALGGEGIGLCRTEHMFFDRILSMRRMILARNEKERREALDELLPLQRKDFEEIFRVMGEKPVTIRTLDPPLHEFLPHTKEEIKDVARALGVTPARVKRRVEEMKEANPMLGHRGCRLGITYPEITEMQARAILQAACRMKKEGNHVKPEIMIPLVGHVKELEDQVEIVKRVAREVFLEEGNSVDFLVGTMIEIPRAAITADRIAAVAEFFSFGTNDLTQTTFGLSRDDTVRIVSDYLAKGILPRDPFDSLDTEGVGDLMRIGVERGRKTRETLKVGICGEHGGDPDSVRFCHRIGLDYVSCSPFRIPIARLAAAQEALVEMREKRA